MGGDIGRQLAGRVREAREDGRPLCIRGGGTKAGLLGRDVDADILDVSWHTGIVRYQPGELVLTARAGTTLAEIEAALDEHGQHLSFEPPRFGPGATLGGTLACNLSGPARPWGGSFRDVVLGVRLINGRGEHLTFGGQVMKNVAGYDIPRLQAGALGTLGVITEISLKVMPRPAATRTLCRAMDESAAIRMMGALSRRPLPLSAAAWMQGRLYLRLAGAKSACQNAVGELGGDRMEHGDSFWADLREHRLDFFSGDLPVWRLSLKPSAPPADGFGETLIDWGGAQRWLRDDADRQELENFAAAHGGHLTLFRGGDRHGEVRHPPPPVQQALQQNLKTAFDPDGILNPGRLYGWM